MLDYCAEEGELRNRHLFLSTHNVIRVSNATDVLHCTVLVVWAHDVVDLWEGISLTEALLVEADCRLCNSEHQFMAQILDQWLSYEDSLWSVHGVKVFEHFVWSSTDCVKVRWYFGGLLKICDINHFVFFEEIEEPFYVVLLDYMQSLLIAFRVFELLLYSVGYCLPILRED